MFNLFNNKNDSNQQQETGTQFYIVSELGQIRYHIEHVVLRNEFFRNTMLLMMELMSDDGAYEFYDMCFKKTGVKNPYLKGEFSVNGGKIDENHLMVSLELPVPEYTPLCYRIYFISTIDFENPAMFTIERSLTDGFICGWDREQHINYHELKDPERKDANLMKATEGYVIFGLYKENIEGKN